MRSTCLCSLVSIFATLAPIIPVSASSVSTNVATAVSKQSATQQCEVALSEAINTVQNDRDVQVATIVTSDLAETYRGFPADTPTELTLALQGNAAPNIMNSPQLMTNISVGLIEQCQGLGLVTFNVYYTDWNEYFGLVNGNVTQFSQCAEDLRERYLNWGEIACL